jgi:23S rRNA (pseudouridine1915-N3)-methyltransferase
MQIRIIAVGKIKERFLQDGIAEYEKRLRPYVKLHVVEIPEEKRPVSASASVESVAMEKEGQRILAAIPEGSFVIALDVKGQGLSSEGLARHLGTWELSGTNNLAIIVGGDIGLGENVLAQCRLRLSLSPMTFTHPMARFILIEQLYRASRIRSGEPYHK